MEHSLSIRMLRLPIFWAMWSWPKTQGEEKAKREQRKLTFFCLQVGCLHSGIDTKGKTVHGECSAASPIKLVWCISSLVWLQLFLPKNSRNSLNGRPLTLITWWTNTLPSSLLHVLNGVQGTLSTHGHWLGVCALTSCVIFPKVCCVSSQVCTRC